MVASEAQRNTSKDERSEFLLVSTTFDPGTTRGRSARNRRFLALRLRNDVSQRLLVAVLMAVDVVIVASRASRVKQTGR